MKVFILKVKFLNKISDINFIKKFMNLRAICKNYLHCIV